MTQRRLDWFFATGLALMGLGFVLEVLAVMLR